MSQERGILSGRVRAISSARVKRFGVSRILIARPFDSLSYRGVGLARSTSLRFWSLGLISAKWKHRLSLKPLCFLFISLVLLVHVPPAVDASSGRYFDNVVVIIMENKGIQDICHNNPPPCYPQGAGQLASLANTYGIALQYTSLGHTSLPNYLGLIAGTNFGCEIDDLPKMSPCTLQAWNATNLVDLFETSHITWRAYMEDMPDNCHGSNSGKYAVRHNPFNYFNDIVSNSTRCGNVVPANPTSCSNQTDCVLVNDLNSLFPPQFMWLTPNVCNDMHGASTPVFSCAESVPFGDQYLARLVPNILRSTTFTTKRAALFITFDEGNGYCPLDGSTTDCMYAVWSGPVAKRNWVSSKFYDHYSFLRTVEVNWGMKPIDGNDANAPIMSEFFGNTPWWSALTAQSVTTILLAISVATPALVGSAVIIRRRMANKNSGKARRDVDPESREAVSSSTSVPPSD